MEDTPPHPWLTHPGRPTSHPGGILIIDPDPAEAEELCLALEQAGHRVLPAPDLDSALSIAAINPIHAVIYDLPERAGAPDFTVLDALGRRSLTASAPKIVLARRAPKEVRIEALRRGADDVLAKPFDTEELALRLERRLVSNRAIGRSAAGPLLRHALALGTLPAPVMIGRYLLEEVIGQGAMGVVLRGVDPRLQRPVAVKILGRSAIQAEQWADVAEMEHEGAALARFDHAHIVKVFDAGLADGLPFLVMELVEGESLDSKLEHGPLEPLEAVKMARAVASALVEAHQNGWVHRDIKPANILIGRLDQSHRLRPGRTLRRRRRRRAYLRHAGLCAAGMPSRGAAYAARRPLCLGRGALPSAFGAGGLLLRLGQSAPRDDDRRPADGPRRVSPRLAATALSAGRQPAPFAAVGPPGDSPAGGAPPRVAGPGDVLRTAAE